MAAYGPFLTRRQWLAAGLLLLLIVVLPTLLWQIDRTQMGLKNDLALGSQSSLARLTERLSDGTGWFIFKSVLEQIDVSLFVLTLLLVYGIYSRKALEVPAAYAILFRHRLPGGHGIGLFHDTP